MEASTRTLGRVSAEQHEALLATRDRTLALVVDLDDDDLARVIDPLLSPLLWDLGHVANFEQRWLLGDGSGSDRALDGLYNPFEHPRAERGGIDFLHRERCMLYMADVRERVLAVLSDCDPARVELVIQHEQQHNETMLQLLRKLPGYRPPPALVAGAPAGVSSRPTEVAGRTWVDFPGGEYEIGSSPGEKILIWDNELLAHSQELAPFSIAELPVTQGEYLDWVDASGADAPEGCFKEDGVWLERAFGQVRAVDLAAAVCHISWFEADAFARAAGARLPTEFEWEVAASYDAVTGRSGRRLHAWGDDAWTPERANLDQLAFGTLPAGSFAGGPGPLEMNGQVWEWTASTFDAYPGFEPMGYAEYSAPFFGAGYRVLRGGSWATRARTVDNRFRNWDLPQRRQIFAGFRLARDGEAT